MRAHTRARELPPGIYLESCFGFVGDKRDGRAPEPTIFIAHCDRRSRTFECRVVVRLSKHPAVPPHDSVRSARSDGIRRGSDFGAKPDGTAAEERRVFRRKAASPEPVVQAGQEICISFQPSQCKFRQWSSLSGSYCLGDVLGPSLHHASSALEKIVPEICSLDASNRMRQRRLRDLPGLPGIGAPVPERASETKWNLLNTRFPEQLAQSRIRHDRPVRGGDSDLNPSAISSATLRISSTLPPNLI